MDRLVPMTPGEFRDFVSRIPVEHAVSQVRLGIWEPEEAESLARAEVAEWLVQGLETPNHFFRVVQDPASGERLGELWYCLRFRGRRQQLFVCWIEIDENHRRRGHATEVLNQLQDEARRVGAYVVGLGVDGDNLAALALYAKMGFVAKNIFMAKPVSPSGRPSSGA